MSKLTKVQYDALRWLDAGVGYRFNHAATYYVTDRHTGHSGMIQKSTAVALAKMGLARIAGDNWTTSLHITDAGRAALEATK